MENGLHRVDFISHNEDVPYTGGGLTSDIHHLKTGNSYRINRKKGKHIDTDTILHIVRQLPEDSKRPITLDFVKFLINHAGEQLL